MLAFSDAIPLLIAHLSLDQPDLSGCNLAAVSVALEILAQALQRQQECLTADHLGHLWAALLARFSREFPVHME